MARSTLTPARLAASARNTPAAVSVVLRHAARSAAQARSVLLRAAPEPVRRLAGGPRMLQARPDLAATALAAAGDRQGAAAVLESAIGARTTSARRQRALAQVALALGRDDLAGLAVAALAVDDPARPRLQGLLLAERGDLSAAVDTLQGMAGLREAGLRRRIEGEVQVLRHTLLDETLALPSPPRRPQGEPRRPLHVVTNALPEVQAGYTVRTHGIVTAQRAAGLDPHVVTRLGFPVDIGAVAAAREVDVDGTPHHRLVPDGPLALPGRRQQEQWVGALTRLVEREHPDLLHAHSKHENAQAALVAGRRTGLPVVYEARGFLEETWRSRGGDRSADSDFYRWSREAETTCMAAADAVVTLAGTMREEIVARGIDPLTVFVVPNAVGQEFVEPPLAQEPARRALGLPADAFVVGTVTTLNGYEGIDTLVEAVRLLDDPLVRLLVVGDGPQGARLRQLAAPYADQMVFTGRVPHALVREHLAAMDLFCVPRRETPVTVLVPPLKPLEAMATGLPVLASDLPPLVEQVEPGRYGWVVPAEDARAWAHQIDLLRYAPGDVQAMGDRAREWVRAHRTWGAAAQRYAEVYALAAGTDRST